MNTIYLTAASLRAVLCYIDATSSPKIAFDTDDTTIINGLIEKIKNAVGDKDGSEDVVLRFGGTEMELELMRQFHGVAESIKTIFDNIEYCSRPQH